MQTKNVKHTLGNGTEINKIRLTADEGKALTLDGETLWNCIDVDSTEGWYEVDAPASNEEIDDETAFRILTGVE